MVLYDFMHLARVRNKNSSPGWQLSMRHLNTVARVLISPFTLVTASLVEVILKDQDKDAKAKQRMEQACTEEEGAMADLIDELFESTNRSAEEFQNEATISLELDMSGDGIASGMMHDEFEDKVHDDDDELIEETSDTANEVTANEVTANEVTDSVIVGSTGKKVKASLATVNYLCFVDIKK